MARFHQGDSVITRLHNIPGVILSVHTDQRGDATYCVLLAGDVSETFAERNLQSALRPFEEARNILARLKVLTEQHNPEVAEQLHRAAYYLWTEHIG